MSTTSQLTDFSDTDLAWAAGFIDGEGCIALIHHHQTIGQKTYQCFVLRLSVANTDLLSLERLKAMFGGSINGAGRSSRPHHKPCWQWFCHSAKAERALIRLLPYLFGKKAQAELGVASRKYVQNNGRPKSAEVINAQFGIFNKLKLMKRAA